MFDLKTIEKMQREAIKRSKENGDVLYLAIENKDKNVFKCPACPQKIKGYKRVNTFFVDNSGFGIDTEPALTANNFLNNRAGYYYGIVSQGQFQVYIAEFFKL